jgi:hypothetical protein
MILRTFWPITGTALLLLSLTTCPGAAQQAGPGGGVGQPGVRGQGGGPGSPLAGSRGDPGAAPGPFFGRYVPGGAERRSPRPEKVAEEIVQLYQQFDDKATQAPPQRTFVVARATDKVKTPLFKADPKLLENKWVAEFTVLPGGLDLKDEKSLLEFENRLRSDDRARGSHPKNLEDAVTWGGRRVFIGGHVEDSSLSKHFQRLADNCPPEQPEVAFLTSPDADRDVQRRPTTFMGLSSTGPYPRANLRAWQFTVFAPTAEQAEQRARAIVRLLDCGMCLPMQRYCLAKGREALVAAHKAEADIAKQNEAIRVEQEKLAKPSEISPDILSQLKAQKVMVAVELAGLIARVKACDEMLKDPKRLEISTLQSISDMKVKAEIERVGIKEKLDQINAFIGEGDGREAASSKLTAAEASKLRAQQLLSSYSSDARGFGQLVELYAPLQLVGNQITISPLEWTN